MKLAYKPSAKKSDIIKNAFEICFVVYPEKINKLLFGYKSESIRSVKPYVPVEDVIICYNHNDDILYLTKYFISKMSNLTKNKLK